jgi:hypothetical protein
MTWAMARPFVLLVTNWTPSAYKVFFFFFFDRDNWQDSFEGGSARRKAAKTQNKRGQISIHPVEFEPAIPVFYQAKKFHVLDHAAIVMGVVKRCISLIQLLLPLTGMVIVL